MCVWAVKRLVVVVVHSMWHMLMEGQGRCVWVCVWLWCVVVVVMWVVVMLMMMTMMMMMNE